MTQSVRTTVRRLERVADLERAYIVMRELRPALSSPAEFRTTVRRLARAVGYRLVGAWRRGQLCALAGYRVGESIAWGRHLYVDDLVTASDHRSAGVGRQLCAWLRAEARRLRCRQWHLDSGVQRHAAHRFYLRERLDITCFHFQADLG